ncbi:MAG: hypothetical protein GY856_25170 [bacterium]|nr:hypothetical protein [bacterium]
MEICEWRHRVRGPFRVDQVPDGSGYELTNGHPVRSAPSTPERASYILRAAGVLRADPGVGWVGTRVGYALHVLTLRCPDVVAEPDGAPRSALAQRHALKLSVALMLSSDPSAGWVSLWGAPTSEPSPMAAVSGDSKAPSWMGAAPRLAIEIVEVGRDEDDLAQKVDELLRAGTRHLWAVRLAGPRRVEVYAPASSPKTFSAERELTADGVLRRAVPVEAFFDQRAATEHVLRNDPRCRGDEALRLAD